MCGGGGDSWSRAGAGNLGLDGGHLLGVWGCPQGEERGERVGLFSLGVIRYSSVYICWLVGLGNSISKINCYKGDAVRNLIAARD